MEESALRLEQATGNHLFDDHPDWFGITKIEGHMLKEYIQGSAEDKAKEYVELFHREFPSFMNSENPSYIRDHVNPSRENVGLPPLEL